MLLYIQAKCSKVGLGWKSLNAPLLWAPLCGANNNRMIWFGLKLKNWIWYTVHVLTLKKAPESKDQEREEEVVGEIIHGGDHHTWGAWWLRMGTGGSHVTCADICGVEAGAARWKWWPVEARGEAWAACWNWWAKVQVGEAPGAENGLRRECRQDADEDEGNILNDSCGQRQVRGKLVKLSFIETDSLADTVKWLTIHTKVYWSTLKPLQQCVASPFVWIFLTLGALKVSVPTAYSMQSCMSWEKLF